MSEALEEQQMEIEALESIYPDEFKVMGQDPYRLSIDLLEGEGDEQFGVRMQATLPAEYPNEPPILEFSILRRVGREQVQRVSEHVTALIEENLGVPMIFTLASAAQEWMQEHVGEAPDLAEEYERNKQQFETFSDEAIYDQTEAIKERGTLVTPESFEAWKLKFDEEFGVVKKEEKVTGRMIFEMGQAGDEDANLEKFDAQESTNNTVAEGGPAEEADPEPTEDDIDLDVWREEINLDDLDDLDDLPSDSDE